MSDETQSRMFPDEAVLKPWQSPGPQYPTGAPHEAASDTSQAAGASILPVLGTLQQRVYQAIVTAGKRGLTDDELERATGLRHQTASARRRELVLAELLDRVEQRPTSSGRMAWAWRSREITESREAQARRRSRNEGIA